MWTERTAAERAAAWTVRRGRRADALSARAVRLRTVAMTVTRADLAAAAARRAEADWAEAVGLMTVLAAARTLAGRTGGLKWARR